MLDSLAILILFISILTGIASGLLYLFRENGNKKANVFCGLLLLAFGVSLFRPWLAYFESGLERYTLFFTPVWYSLALGPLLFYFVKFHLYPVYQLRWTDAKHLVLPLAQALFYWIMYFQPEAIKLWVWEEFVLSFFKTFEGILFVISFFSYLAIAFRYIKFKQATLLHRGFEWQRQKALWLRRLVLVSFFVAGVNSFYIVLDFALYYFWSINLQNVPGFGFIGDVSFAAVLIWLVYKAFQNALFGPYAFFTPSSPQAQYPYSPLDRPEKTTEFEQLQTLLKEEHIYRDPDIKSSILARMLGVSPRVQAAIVKQQKGISLKKWIHQLRLEEVIRRLKSPAYRQFSLSSIGYDSGFNSRRRLNRVFQSELGMSILSFPRNQDKQTTEEVV